ncbi:MULTISPECIES: Ig-like domain-containing protein [Anaeromyxobacter]|uniref:PKD domain-containing protein n=1 Tax=Anaeromyxobacter TaxID=161492 RepID=UPI001F5AEDBB|nr:MULTISPECIES: hypothetical protein [unclassified Anaeromyxobacter]
MRLPTSTKLAVALAALLAAACQQDTITSPDASCRPTGTACGENADCCSYGCVQGTCMRNPLEGGMCRNSDDCGYPRVCVASHCTSEVQCRVDGDTCGFSNECCSGLCRMDTNTCAPDRAPVADAGADATVPRHVPFTLSNASSDPDGTALEYTWSLRPPPGSTTAVLSSTTGATPSFTPDVTGLYELTLTVSDGFLTTTDTVVVTAINTAPAVTVTVPATQSRNVSFTAQGTVADADGDPLECSWTVTPPGGTAQPAGTPGSCRGAVSLPVTCGPAPADEGDWVVTLAATDGVNTTTVPKTVTCVNDAPVAEAGPARAVNRTATPTVWPSVATQASATDVNGDTTFTWAWAVVDTPTGSAVTAGSLTGADTASASFTPDLLGDYVLQVTVCDRPGACTSDTVTVTAYPHIQDLGHEVRDAEYAAGKIVLVGADPAVAGGGRLWVLDANTGAETASVALQTAPNVVGVLASGATAVVGDDVWLRVVSLGATPAVTSSISANFQVNDLAAVSSRHVFVFPKASGQWIGDLDTSNGALTTRGLYGTAGAADPTDPNRFYVADGSSVEQWVLQNSGDLLQLGTASGCTSARLWVEQNGNHLFSTCNLIYSTADYLSASMGSFPGVTSVRFAHADTLGNVALLDATATAVHRYDASFVALPGAATEPIPVWAEASAPYAAEGLFVFVAPDGSRNAIVRATVGGATRYGLVKFPQ